MTNDLAIRILTGDVLGTSDQTHDAIKMAVKALSLPSAQPERKKGKWIKNDNGTYSCNQCHSWIPEEQHYYAKYCLYCSAEMRGEANESSNTESSRQ